MECRSTGWRIFHRIRTWLRLRKACDLDKWTGEWAWKTFIYPSFLSSECTCFTRTMFSLLPFWSWKIFVFIWIGTFPKRLHVPVGGARSFPHRSFSIQVRRWSRWCIRSKLLFDHWWLIGRAVSRDVQEKVCHVERIFYQLFYQLWWKAARSSW